MNHIIAAVFTSKSAHLACIPLRTLRLPDGIELRVNLMIGLQVLCFIVALNFNYLFVLLFVELGRFTSSRWPVYHLCCFQFFLFFCFSHHLLSWLEWAVLFVACCYHLILHLLILVEDVKIVSIRKEISFLVLHDNRISGVFAALQQITSSPLENISVVRLDKHATQTTFSFQRLSPLLLAYLFMLHFN